METSDSKMTTSKPSAPLPPAVRPPSPPLSDAAPTAEHKLSTDTRDHATTPPFSPTSQTPVLQKEQEDFEGTVDVNNDLPTEKDLQAVGDLLVLDAQGQSRPFKELYDAPHTAPRQLIIFIRHFFCGVSRNVGCEEHTLTEAELPGVSAHTLVLHHA